MGFLLAGNGLLVVFLTIMVYKKVSPGIANNVFVKEQPLPRYCGLQTSHSALSVIQILLGGSIMAICLQCHIAFGCSDTCCTLSEWCKDDLDRSYAYVDVECHVNTVGVEQQLRFSNVRMC